MRRFRSIAVLSLVVWTGLGAVSQRVRAEDTLEDARKLSVGGEGKISAAPDTAEINIGVISQAATAREALSANNEKMVELQRTLKDRGVAAKDIQTTNINVNPRYSQPGPRRVNQQENEFVPRIVGYDVTNMVRITSRDIDQLGPLLDSVVSAGANQMHGINFRIEEPSKLLDEARKRAMADARRKAELLAGEAQLVLGNPISITEATGAPPRPMYDAPRAMMAMAESVPVAPGEQELRVTVQVVYELKLPER